MLSEKQLQTLAEMYPDKTPYADGRVHFDENDDLYGVKIYRTDEIMMYNYPCYAEWCNKFSGGKATIEQKEDATKTGEEAIYYEVVRIPDPTPEELQDQVRSTRDMYLREYVDPIVTNPLRWEEMSDDAKAEMKAYRRYLLDYPESNEYWYLESPKTFDEWCEAK